MTTLLVGRSKTPDLRIPGFSVSVFLFLGAPLPKGLRKPGAREDDTDSLEARLVLKIALRFSESTRL